MTDARLGMILGAAVAGLGIIPATIAALAANRAARNSKENKEKLDEIGPKVDGRLSDMTEDMKKLTAAFLVLTANSSYAKGVADQKAVTESKT